MKKTAFLILLLLTAAGNAPAVEALGSSFGTLTTARSVGYGAGVTTLGVGIADLTSVSGIFDYGISDHTDVRLKFGVTDESDVDAALTIGAEAKYHLLDVRVGDSDPFDLAVGAGTEYVKFDNIKVFQAGAMVTGSYSFELANRTILTPYSRFNIRLERSSFDIEKSTPQGQGQPPLISTENVKESELKLGFSAGACWALSSAFSLLAELQLDGNDGLFLGLNYAVL